MAIDLKMTFPDNVDAATPAYPLGTPRDDSVPGANDGTPREQRYTKDQASPFWAALDRAGITPSGSPESATASDFIDAIINHLALDRNQLESNGGTVLEDGSRIFGQKRAGLIFSSPAANTLGVSAGRISNFPVQEDLVLPADIEKVNNSAWTLGTGGGLTPASLVGTTGWLRVFLITRPSDGLGDIVVDTDRFATNAFADVNVNAAGFTDTTLFRRIGWGHVDGTLVLDPWLNSEEFPDRFIHPVPFEIFDVDVPWPALFSVDLSAGVAPNCRAGLATYASWDVAADNAYVHPDQLNAQQLPGIGFHMLSNATASGEFWSTIFSEHFVDDTSKTQVRCSVDTPSPNVMRAVVHYWIDDLEVL